MREGATAEHAAEVLAARFRHGFARELATNPLAQVAFPACFGPAGEVKPAEAEQAAREEWEAWIGGGYAVCLRIFTPETCVEKESLAASLKHLLLSGGDEVEMLAQAESLSGIILPFAPWERPTGTPGVTIDRLVERCSLGEELPYA